MRVYYVNILTTKNNKIFYIGTTDHLEGRVWQHICKFNNGFTSKYNVNKLVYYEEYRYVWDAIRHERQLKNWHRQWKINLIRQYNQDFNNLAAEWFDNGKKR